MKKEDLHIERRDRYEWLDLIDRWIFDERDRKMLVRVLLDGASVESCQELVGLERRQTQRRFDKAITQLAQHC